MANTASFDVVSKFDFQEMKNAVDQAQREIQQRYDLKDTGTEIELTEKEIKINTQREYSLQAVRDAIESKMVKRGLSLKILDSQEGGAGVRRPGSPDHQAQAGAQRRDLAKQIAKRIRDEFKKVTPQIQGDLIRVQAKSKDDLQAVIQALKGIDDYPVALQFVNYR